MARHGDRDRSRVLHLHLDEVELRPSGGIRGLVAFRRGGHRHRPGRVGAQRPATDGVGHDDETGAVVEHCLDLHVVEDVGDSRQHVVRTEDRAARSRWPRRGAFPSRAASATASATIAVASGTLSRRPRARRAPGELGDGEQQEPVALGGGQLHAAILAGRPRPQAAAAYGAPP